MMDDGASLGLCIIMDQNDYGTIKLEADKLGFMTQCGKFDKITKNPRGYTFNMMLKINTKLGGINHALISRLPEGEPVKKVFQCPPASITWLFDEPCMVVGIDVSHGEPSSSSESVAAVVGSMDGSCAQYAAHLSVQTARQEICSGLDDGIRDLLNTFRAINGVFPTTMICYRDGVSEGQFSMVTTQELEKIQSGIVDDFIV